MAVRTSMVHVRVDMNVKKQAVEMLASKGLTLSDAVREFLNRVVADKQLPFALDSPNTTSRTAIAEANEILKRRRARFTSTDAPSVTLKTPSRRRAKLRPNGLV